MESTRDEILAVSGGESNIEPEPRNVAQLGSALG